MNRILRLIEKFRKRKEVSVRPPVRKVPTGYQSFDKNSGRASFGFGDDYF